MAPRLSSTKQSRHRTLWMATIVACAATGLVAERVRAWAAPAQRARPPKFSKSIDDVFFPDARTKLVGPRPTASAPAAARTPPTLPSATAVKVAASPWAKLISADAIEDEIKAQQQDLNKSVENLGRFKSREHQLARLQCSILAALFAFDAQYGTPMRWQREAAAVSSQLARAAANCKVGTEASFKDAKASATLLQDLMRGGSAKAAAEGGESSWAETAARPELMKRLEQSIKRLETWTADAETFSRQQAAISHEAQLIAAFAEVIQHKSYELADDETYHEHAVAMQKAAVSVRAHADQDDHETARVSVGEVRKSCTTCHEGFRT